MHFQPADYVLGVFTIFMAVTGLLRGFSGVFALLVAGAATSAIIAWAWPASASFIASRWHRAFAIAATAILSFGIIRIIVKKAVGGLLDQPLDAIAGCLTGLACVALTVLAISAVPESRSYSLVARGVAYYVW